MEKTQYKESQSLDTYRVDRSKTGKATGIWQVMQEAACHQMETQKPSYTDLLDDGQALMLARVDLAIPEEIYLDEKLISSSWPCPSARATFLRNYTLEKEGRRAAIAATQWTLVDLETRKILKIDEVDFSNYWYDEYIELMPGKFKIDRKNAEKMQQAGEKTVRYSDLDYNGHMNNTYYLDMLCDYIPELAEGTHRVSFLRIHYSKEAPLGEKLTIFRDEGCLLTEEEKKAYKVPAEKKYLFRTVKTNGELNVEAEITVTPLR